QQRESPGASRFALIASLKLARRFVMPKHSVRRLAIGALAIFMVVGFLLVDSSAQKRRHKRRSSRPRITNPEIYQPSSNDNANSNASVVPANVNSNETTNNQTDKETIRTLSSQVDKLTDKINQMEQSQRSLVDLERLSRAEQRSAQLHAELRDVQAKEADLQARSEEHTSELQS